MRRKFLAPAALAACMVAGAAVTPASALTITPYGLGALPTGAQTTINDAINFYEGTFADPIAVPIDFVNMTSGLGASISWVAPFTYSSYYGALAADATTANDATALANTPSGPINPADGTTSIELKIATANAVGGAYGPVSGLPAPCDSALALDGCIGLNLAITNYTGHTGTYGLLGVVEHEIDEVLGLGSSLGSTFYASPEDLFRWASTGVRSYSTNPGTVGNPVCPGGTPSAYFSINGGATPLDYFNNCDNGGDYGDWVLNSPPQVQDAYATPGGNPFLTATSPEVTALDVIGYTPATQAPVPEPVTAVLFGTGLVGIIRRRRVRR